MISIEEVEKNYDKVLDIFVRTNAGGTKLSYSDLLFSKIKSKWDEARGEFEKLLDNINENDKYKFSNDFVLKTILVIYAKDRDGIRYKTNNFNPALINEIKGYANWRNIGTSITLAKDVLRDRILLTSDKALSSYNAIIPIIYWIHKNKKNIKALGAEKNCLSNTDVFKIRIWLIKALLNGVFGGQADTILFKCKEAIDKSSHDYFPSEEIESAINNETKKSMKLESDYLDKVTYNSRNSHLVLSICYNGAINFQPALKANLPEQDHIFSQSELKNAGIPEDKINSIYNIRYISSTENKSKSATPFTEWIQRIDDDEKKRHLIPDGKWNINNFDDFLAERKRLIEENFKY